MVAAKPQRNGKDQTQISNRNTTRLREGFLHDNPLGPLQAFSYSFLRPVLRQNLLRHGHNS
jgi:hypothetical protein